MMRSRSRRILDLCKPPEGEIALNQESPLPSVPETFEDDFMEFNTNMDHDNSFDSFHSDGEDDDFPSSSSEDYTPPVKRRKDPPPNNGKTASSQKVRRGNNLRNCSVNVRRKLLSTPEKSQPPRKSTDTSSLLKPVSKTINDSGTTHPKQPSVSSVLNVEQPPDSVKFNSPKPTDSTSGPQLTTPTGGKDGGNQDSEQFIILGECANTVPSNLESSDSSLVTASNVFESIAASSGSFHELEDGVLVAEVDLPVLSSNDIDFTEEEILMDPELLCITPVTPATELRTRRSRKDMPREENSRLRSRNPSKWKASVVKEACNTGQAYVNLRGKPRSARRMKSLCEPGKCRFKCSSNSNLTQENRQAVFEKFYKLGDRSLQWTFIGNNIEISAPKRQTTNWASARKFSRKYFLPIAGERIRVCQRAFLATLDISEMAVRTASRKKFTYSPDKRGGVKGKSKLAATILDGVKAHINSFPRIPSHYCRKDSKREYVEGGLSRKRMHNLYILKMKEDGQPTNKMATERQYRDIFNKCFNIGFHRPKKDQCDQCTAYENATASEKDELEEIQKQHKSNSDLARAMKDADKVRAQLSDNCCVASFDLQKILSVPHGETSSFYYVSKISCFNFTVFDLGKSEGYCYFWNEEIGRKGSNEVGSSLMLFVEKQVTEKKKKEFIFYSDNCTGQNKNKFIYFLWMHLAQKYNIKITHRFLEVGHTQTEGDSMHSVIERKSKGKCLYTPDEWLSLIKFSKDGSKPYVVTNLTQDNIMDLKPAVKNQNWEKDTEGNTISWKKIREVKIDCDSPGILKLKYNFVDESFTHSIHRSRGRPVNIGKIVFNKAFMGKLTIPEKKVKPLLKLCEKGLIPSSYHSFYKGLRASAESEDVDDVQSD